MKALFALFMLRIERAFLLADAYLADCRGDMLEVAECECRARDVERQIDVIDLNRRFGHG
jgi:hypothetical protein